MLKKWICFLVCILMIVSCGFTVTAEPEEEIYVELSEHDVVMEPERMDDGSIRVWVNDAEALVIVMVLAVPITKSPLQEHVDARGIVVSVRFCEMDAEPGE